jgi:hypothetical protein
MLSHCTYSFSFYIFAGVDEQFEKFETLGEGPKVWRSVDQCDLN